MSIMNLVLVTIDCLRADHAGFMGYSRPTTPCLDSIADSSIILEQAEAAGSPTYYSFPAILASRYPLALGRNVLGLSRGDVSLSTVLRQAGYSTAAFTAGNFYVSRSQGYSYGFDTWEDWCPSSMTNRVDGSGPEQRAPSTNRAKNAARELVYRVPSGRRAYEELGFWYGYWRTARRQAGRWDEQRKYPSAGQVTERVLTWLRAQTTLPFFLWIHYMDPHSPRYPSADSLASLDAARMDPRRQFLLNSIWLRTDVSTGYLRRYRQDLLSCYDAGIRDVDTQIGRLWNWLSAGGLREQTVFAVLADHGEEFLEHGRFGHTPPRLYEELTHVPVLLRVPGITARRVTQPFSLIDFSPTLLQALSLPIPESFEGVSRWEQMREGSAWQATVIAEAVKDCREPWHDRTWLGPRLLAVREGRYKLILDLQSRSEELYDLGGDPGEQSPVPSDGFRDLRARLLRGARDHLRKSRTAISDGDRLAAGLEKMRLDLSKRG
ncbi:MAG: sulfatase [Rudaea sp.]